MYDNEDIGLIIIISIFILICCVWFIFDNIYNSNNINNINNIDEHRILNNNNNNNNMEEIPPKYEDIN